MNRREFIRSSLPATLLPLLSGFPVKAFNMPGLAQLCQQHTNALENILILVQLSGGNDGLNTVIPISMYDNYFNARPNIAIPQKKILPIDGTIATGLHPALTGLRDLYNNAQLGIIQSVGYASPDFSHFRASDIWQSGSDSNEVLSTGWVGRYLDYMYPGFPTSYPNPLHTDPPAIQIGSGTSLALQGPLTNMAVNIENPADVYKLTSSFSDAVQNQNSGSELGYIRQVAQQAHVYTKVVSAAFNKVKKQSTYPDNALAQQLKVVASLIKGGLKTKIYLLSVDGYDTHANQAVLSDPCTGKHAELLKTLGGSIKAFQQDLKLSGVQDNVMGVTFSEFGRRIKSNDSAGTDHGTAAPMFVFGSKIIPGTPGENPVIPAAVTDKDNIPVLTDYRCVYATLLQQWLGLTPKQSASILLNDYKNIAKLTTHQCAV